MRRHPAAGVVTGKVTVPWAGAVAKRRGDVAEVPVTTPQGAAHMARQWGPPVKPITNAVTTKLNHMPFLPRANAIGLARLSSGANTHSIPLAWPSMVHQGATSTTIDVHQADNPGLSCPPTSFADTMTPQIFKTACSNCNLRELCMPVGLSDQQLQRIDEMVSARRKVKRGQALFHNGDRFSALFAIRTGFFKTTIATEDGRDQVTGFQMAGEILGLDGIVNDRHNCDAIALEDAEVCVMPFEQIEELAREVNALQHHVHKMMSREIVREHSVMLLLGSMRAEERLAAFLLNLVQRLHARGFSQSELILRMTREEIGSYLGLKLETVSRTFSKFAEEGWVEVKQRHVRIVDAEALRRTLNNQPLSPCN